MRRRLEQLLNESFEYETPRLQVSDRELNLEAKEGGTLRGELQVSHPDSKRCRGFVYSSNPRLVVQPRDFYSTKAQIRWQADLTGLRPGDTLEGRITFCTDLGERAVPFHFVVKGAAETPAAEETFSLDDLAELAQKDMASAGDIFSSGSFAKWLAKDSFEMDTLSQALSPEKEPKRALEQFLIAAGKKDPIEFTLSESTRQIVNPEGTILESVTLTKSTWGFQELEISSDARFLRVEKKKVTTEEFVGSSWDLRYIIDSNFLHAGRNLGRITVKSCYQTIAFELCVEMKGGIDLRSHRVRNVMTRRAICLYLDYRLGRVDLHQWAERTQGLIASYRRAGGNNILADLLEVFALQADGKRTSAQRLLHQVERTSQIRSDANAQAAWLYLSVFFSQDPRYTEQVREQVRSLYLENRNSWLIRWLTLFLSGGDLEEDAGRLDAILAYIEAYSSSEILFLEGAQIAVRNPFLLHEWTAGARMIVNFAVKEKLADERLILHSMNLIRRKGQFDPATFRMLQSCYELSHLDDVLAVWTQMAIDGNKTQEKYFPLYQSAVARDLKITGLYEYYMQTMGEVRIEQMPQVIRRYFVMNDSLDWRKKARIYRNLSDMEGSIPQIFSSMRAHMEQFVVDQIRMSRINQDLAVLIRRYLPRDQITGQMAKKLIRLLFTFEVDCLSPLMKRVIIADSRQNREHVTQIVDHKAQVRIYSEQSRILLEDDEGHRYASTSLYMAQHLLDDPELMNLCVQKAPEDPHLVLFFTLNPGRTQPITHRMLRFYLDAAQMAALSEDYRTLVRSWLLDYYYRNPDEETLTSFLREIDLDVYVRIDRQKILCLLTQQGRYESAWTIIEQYGMEGVDLNRLMRILSQTVLMREYEEDQTLIGFCASLFAAGKVEEHILIYLLMYYDGPVESMKSLWRVGREYELDTINLEKKILSLIIFSKEGSADSEQIYLSYRRSLGSRRICQAYVILRCYEYLVKGKPVQDMIFDDCQKDYEKGGKLPDVCSLAMLQYFSHLPQFTAQQEKTAVELLKRYNEKGIRFAFFQRFPKRFKESLSLEDKVFCEAVADPGSSLKLFYRFKHENDPFIETTMRDVFEGIRVREFVLFEGEQIECYTEEIKTNGEKITSGHRFLSAPSVPEELEGSRYARLIKMDKCLRDADREELEKELKEYRYLDSLTKELFTLIE